MTEPTGYPIGAAFQGLSPSPDFYFVHSYHMINLPKDVQATYCMYGEERVTAAVQLGNIYGTQFHPEKSQAAGLQLLRNFVYWQP